MIHIVGFSLALLSALFFGLYMVPRKYSRLPQPRFLLSMGTGILIGSTLYALLLNRNFHITHTQYLHMFFAGLLWGSGTLGYTYGVQWIGLSRSSPIKNMTALWGTLIGIFIFHEFSTGEPLRTGMVIIGSVLATAAAIVLGKVGITQNGQRRSVPLRDFLLGVGASLWASVGYSYYTIPMKITFAQGVGPIEFLFYMGQGCFVGMAALSLFIGGGWRAWGRFSVKDDALAALAGFTWATAAALANTALGIIGIAITWPVTNMNTVVGVAYGVWVLKEIDPKVHKRELFLGLGSAAAGVVLLALAMR